MASAPSLERRLDAAVAAVAADAPPDAAPVSVSVVWHPFILARGLPDTGLTLAEYFVYKAGLAGSSPPALASSLRAMDERLRREGRSAGIEFVPSEDRRIFPTIRSHVVVEYARRRGVRPEAVHALMDEILAAYFERGTPLNSPDMLAAAAEAGANIPAAEIRALLLDRPDEFARVAADVEREAEDATARGIHGVPHFVFSTPDVPGVEPVVLSGAQPEAVFRSVIQDLCSRAAGKQA